MAKPKQLNPNSSKEFIRQQIKVFEEQLKEPVLLNKAELEELLKQYEESLATHEFAESTRLKYVRNAKWFTDKFSSNEKHLTKNQVIKFKDYVQNKYTSVQTINSYITTINRFLHFCDLGDLTVAKVKTQSENVINDRIYEHEYKRMLRKSKQLGWMDLHYLMRLMAETGIRVAERKSVTVEAINSSTLDFKVNNKGKWRIVPVPQKLSRELRKYAKSKGLESGPLLNMDYKKDIYNPLKRLAGICKIKKEKVTPHAFRHYFGFRYAEINGDSGITQLADIMGHSSVETTRVYTRGTSKDYRKTMEKMV